MADAVLTINAGSSSLKFSVYRIGEDDRPSLSAKGQVDVVGLGHARADHEEAVRPEARHGEVADQSPGPVKHRIQRDPALLRNAPRDDPVEEALRPRSGDVVFGVRGDLHQSDRIAHASDLVANRAEGVGHHVGIMKDGRIVQIGTPEEVVTNPADAYVAKFVQGISRLKLVRAARAMIPIGQYCRTPEHPSFADAPRAGPEADLDQLIELSNGAGNRPIVVVDGSGREVGVVTTATLLRSIQGRAVGGFRFAEER